MLNYFFLSYSKHPNATTKLIIGQTQREASCKYNVGERPSPHLWMGLFPHPHTISFPQERPVSFPCFLDSLRTRPSGIFYDSLADTMNLLIQYTLWCVFVVYRPWQAKTRLFLTLSHRQGFQVCCESWIWRSQMRTEAELEACI